MAKGSIRIAGMFILLAAGSGCSHRDIPPDDFRLIQKEVAAQQLLSKILRECAISEGSSICRRTLPDFCQAVVTVEGNAYRCPSTML